METESLSQNPELNQPIIEDAPDQEQKPKDLSVTSAEEAKAKISDVETVGDGDLFQLLSKARSAEQGWLKSTKVCAIDDVGCLVQVTTQQRNPDGTYALAEAVTFVPGVRLRTLNGQKSLVKS